MKKRDINYNEFWLKSKEVIKILKISACHLSHIREDGKLGFMKNGNAYLYKVKDVILYKKLK